MNYGIAINLRAKSNYEGYILVLFNLAAMDFKVKNLPIHYRETFEQLSEHMNSHRNLCFMNNDTSPNKFIPTIFRTKQLLRLEEMLEAEGTEEVKSDMLQDKSRILEEIDKEKKSGVAQGGGYTGSIPKHLEDKFAMVQEEYKKTLNDKPPVLGHS